MMAMVHVVFWSGSAMVALAGGWLSFSLYREERVQQGRDRVEAAITLAWLAAARPPTPRPGVHPPGVHPAPSHPRVPVPVRPTRLVRGALNPDRYRRLALIIETMGGGLDCTQQLGRVA